MKEGIIRPGLQEKIVELVKGNSQKWTPTKIAKNLGESKIAVFFSVRALESRGILKTAKVGGAREVYLKNDDQPQDLPETTTKQEEKDLPLSDEEIAVLSVYQEDDSPKVLADKTKITEGRVDSVITSILIKKNVATLGEAKEVTKLIKRTEA